MPNKKIDVGFIRPNLSRCSTQRIMTYVTSDLDKSTFQCPLLIISHPKATDFEITGMKVKHFKKKRLLFATTPLFFHLLRSLYDIIIRSIGLVKKLLGFYSYIIKRSIFFGREASLDTIAQKYNKSKEHFLIELATNITA